LLERAWANPAQRTGATLLIDDKTLDTMPLG